MARRDPTAAEMCQRRRAGAAEARADRLAADSAGTAEIAAQAARIAGLEEVLAASEARALRQENRADRLSAENRELKSELKGAREELRRLRWDAKVAHSEWRGSTGATVHTPGRGTVWLVGQVSQRKAWGHLAYEPNCPTVLPATGM